MMANKFNPHGIVIWVRFSAEKNVATIQRFSLAPEH